MANKFGAFIVGGLVGAGVALLCAPRKGVETRALVADKASAAFGQAQTLGGQAAERSQEFYSEAVASVIVPTTRPSLPAKRSTPTSRQWGSRRMTAQPSACRKPPSAFRALPKP